MILLEIYFSKSQYKMDAILTILTPENNNNAVIFDELSYFWFHSNLKTERCSF
jgi:hypothetical protein